MNRQKQIEQAAREFHNNNPKVWLLFVKFTTEAINRGFKHFGAKAVMERVRWENSHADAMGRNEFTINNNYVAYYARWFGDVFPEYADFFRTRDLISKDVKPSKLPELTPEDFGDV